MAADDRQAGGRGGACEDGGNHDCEKPKPKRRTDHGPALTRPQAARLTRGVHLEIFEVENELSIVELRSPDILSRF